MRHGESLWNQEGRFTGWRDIDLSEKGIQEAKQAAGLIKKHKLHFCAAYSSFLKRAIRTLWILLDELDLMWIPTHFSWRLNERHYGALQSREKKEMENQYGKKQVFLWRRSYRESPPVLSHRDKTHPIKDLKYKNLKEINGPFSESLEQTEKRLIPYWKDFILKTLVQFNPLLIVAHGNSLRALAKYVEGLSEDEIAHYNISTASPYIYELDQNFNFMKKYELSASLSE